MTRIKLSTFSVDKSLNIIWLNRVSTLDKALKFSEMLAISA